MGVRRELEAGRVSEICQGTGGGRGHGHIRYVCQPLEDNGHDLHHDLAGSLSQQLCTQNSRVAEKNLSRGL